MIYVQKEKTPDDIQEEINRLTGTKKWAAFPEHPSSEEAHAIRDHYFNRLNKSRVREALLAEQRGLCAYCMCRITNHGSFTTIEHVMPLSRSKAGAMDYQNWLAVCKGGTNFPKPGNGRRIICCDAKKGNTITTLTPLDRRQMAGIAYYDDGTLYYQAPNDPDRRKIVHDINDIYGLNGIVDPKTGRSRKDTTSGIVKHRKDAYISMFEELMRLEAEGELTLDLVRRFRESLLSEDKWEPFIGVKLHVLDMFLKTLGEE